MRKMPSYLLTIVQSHIYEDEMKLGFIHAARVLSLRVWMGRPRMGSPETAGTPCNKKKTIKLIISTPFL
jgi:hypothetical protein